MRKSKLLGSPCVTYWMTSLSGQGLEELHLQVLKATATDLLCFAIGLSRGSPGLDRESRSAGPQMLTAGRQTDLHGRSGLSETSLYMAYSIERHTS